MQTPHRSMLQFMLVAGLSASAACASTTNLITAPVAPDSACAVSAEDRAWIDSSLAAWRLTSQSITGIKQLDNFRAIFFDEDCVLSSAAAMSLHGPSAWTALPHDGVIELPNNEQLPAGVTSFTSGSAAGPFFVMALPSIWRAQEVNDRELGLETLMTAVLLHEASHVAQFPTYGEQVTRLITEFSLPDSFGDDSVQHRFADDPAFSESVARETELFFAAAAAADEPTARRLAADARDLLRARHRRWLTGDLAYMSRAEDLFLTLEGAGQWAAVQWLSNAAGAALPPATVVANYAKRSKWWTQLEGAALFLAIDRIDRGAWQAHAFGDGAFTALQLLDRAIDVR